VRAPSHGEDGGTPLRRSNKDIQRQFRDRSRHGSPARPMYDYITPGGGGTFDVPPAQRRPGRLRRSGRLK